MSKQNWQMQEIVFGNAVDMTAKAVTMTIGNVQLPMTTDVLAVEQPNVALNQTLTIQSELEIAGPLAISIDYTTVTTPPIVLIEPDMLNQSPVTVGQLQLEQLEQQQLEQQLQQHTSLLSVLEGLGLASSQAVVKPVDLPEEPLISAEALLVDANALTSASISVADEQSQSTAQTVTQKLVLWSSVATGHLSQAFSSQNTVAIQSINFSGVISSQSNNTHVQPLSNNVQALAVKAKPPAFNLNAKFNETQKVRQQALHKANTVAASKESSALWQSVILPQKVTYSPQLQKMWVRDYFMTQHQTAQLINTMKSGFADNNAVQSLVVNGQSVYQRGAFK
jgi:hypothetical protein